MLPPKAAISRTAEDEMSAHSGAADHNAFRMIPHVFSKKAVPEDYIHIQYLSACFPDDFRTDWEWNRSRFIEIYHHCYRNMIKYSGSALNQIEMTACDRIK